jgi:hypothetical protein
VVSEVVCSCDLDLESLCEGNQQLNRCATKVGSTGQPGVVTPAATRSFLRIARSNSVKLLFSATAGGIQHWRICQHFFERYYRGMHKISSDDCNMCMTHALSKADDEKGRRACDHQYSPKCELM